MTAIATSDVRQRAIEAYRSRKGTQKQIAQLFGITTRAFQKWWKAYCEDGRTEPLPRGHNPPALNARQMQRLDKMLQSNADMTLRQLREALDVSCSLVAIHYSTLRLNWRYKKNRYERVSEIDPT